jgi:ABC-2 type transport system ATP-binding protein
VIETPDDGSAPEPSLDGLGGDFAVSAEAGRVVVEGVGPRDIDTVVAAFDDRGIGVDSLTWAQPDLGDVYLELTGESFAGDAVGADSGGAAG